MDRGPLRAPRPTVGAGEREHQNTATTQAHRTEAPSESRMMSESTRRVSSDRRPNYRREKSAAPWVWIGGIVGIILLGALGWFAWTNASNSETAIDSKKYQAVFFTNGQVYFGKLTYSKGEYMKLSDVFYIQPSSSANGGNKNTQSSTDSSSMQLIKLGDEVHGPEDEMMIAKSQVLFYENLREDGKVAQQIQKYSAGK